MYSYSNHTFSYDYVQLCSLEHDLKLLPAVITDWHVLEQVLTGGRIAEPDNLAMVGGREKNFQAALARMFASHCCTLTHS